MVLTHESRSQQDQFVEKKWRQKISWDYPFKRASNINFLPLKKMTFFMYAHIRHVNAMHAHAVHGHALLLTPVMHTSAVHAYAAHCMFYVRIYSDMSTVARGPRSVYPMWIDYRGVRH
jgi:hypothetical protein